MDFRSNQRKPIFCTQVPRGHALSSWRLSISAGFLFPMRAIARAGSTHFPLCRSQRGAIAVYFSRQAGLRYGVTSVHYESYSVAGAPGGLWPTGFGHRRVQSSREFAESGSRSGPTQLVNIIEKLYVSPERGQRAKEDRVFPLTRQGIRKSARVGRVYMPLAVVRGNRFEMDKL